MSHCHTDAIRKPAENAAWWAVFGASRRVDRRIKLLTSENSRSLTLEKRVIGMALRLQDFDHHTERNPGAGLR